MFAVPCPVRFLMFKLRHTYIHVHGLCSGELIKTSKIIFYSDDIIFDVMENLIIVAGLQNVTDMVNTEDICKYKCDHYFSQKNFVKPIKFHSAVFIRYFLLLLLLLPVDYMTYTFGPIFDVICV